MSTNDELHFEKALAIKETQRTEGWNIIARAIDERISTLKQEMQDLLRETREKAESGTSLETIGARILSTSSELDGVTWIRDHIQHLVARGERSAERINTP